MFCSFKKSVIRIIQASPFVTIAFSTSSCHSKHIINNDQLIYGTWIVDDIKIDEGAWRTQGHDLHDNNYIGKRLRFTPNSVTSDLEDTDLTEGVDCVQPRYSTMKMTLRKLLSGTLARRNYPFTATTPADYELPDSPKPIEIIVVTCRTGGVGNTQDTPTIPFPDNATWLARIDDRHLVVHWFDDSMLVLSRPDDRQSAAQRAKLLQGPPDEKRFPGLVARRKAELNLYLHGVYK